MAELGIQLYTLRDRLAKNFIETVRAVREIGYDGVEFPGGVMNQIGAVQLRELMDDLDLTLIGIVFDHNDLIKNMENVIAYCKASGCTTALYPYIPDDLRRTEQEFRDTAKQINEFGKTLASHGIRFLYHIHGYEFKSFGSVTGMDILLQYFKPGNTGLEIDVFWVEYGGSDAVAFMGKHAHVSPYIHAKDYTGNFRDTEVGCGSIKFPEIIKIGLSNNVEWIIVEQEEFDRDPMESAAISYNNIRKFLSTEAGR